MQKFCKDGGFQPHMERSEIWEFRGNVIGKVLKEQYK
ncbi:hypothetical protein Barb6XT_00929 [Bacteroidales bacterium Barb6XT]|nr:hypothetical protein Barb6XT_00929 [Bacteroidales bacterium Barb6XT]